MSQFDLPIDWVGERLSWSEVAGATSYGITVVDGESSLPVWGWVGVGSSTTFGAPSGDEGEILGAVYDMQVAVAPGATLRWVITALDPEGNVLATGSGTHAA